MAENNPGLLGQIPPPPTGRRGWPWTTQTNPLIYSPSVPWPQISIVTPSYNQGEYIEETIRSVLLQNYPNLEYIVIDGKSHDNSLKIIEKYSPWISVWKSEKDGGQSEALNKGFMNTSGSILAWINSDDLYCEGSLSHVATRLAVDKPEWIVGSAEVVNRSSQPIGKVQSVPITENTFTSWNHNYIYQPSVFWNRKLADIIGTLVDDKLRYIMDVDLWYRMFQITAPKYTEVFLSKYRLHSHAKTTAEWNSSADEMAEWMYKLISQQESGKDFFKQFFSHATEAQRNLERISDHPIFGRFIRIWYNFVNRDFKVLDNCRLSHVKNAGSSLKEDNDQ